MRIPRIALNASYLQRDKEGWAVTVKSAYPDAILRAGGAPVILPPIENPATLHDILAGIDGLLLIGGGDIRAARYGAEQSPLGDLVNPRREDFDFALLAQALDLGKPVLGICLGCQELNVHYGGTLYQDLTTEMAPTLAATPNTIQHSAAQHDVTITPNTLLARIVGAGSLHVNSTHHQAIRGVGRGLAVSARSSEGLVEAVEDPARPFVLGVQWHPEGLADEPQHMALFERFIETAGEQ